MLIVMTTKMRKLIKENPSLVNAMDAIFSLCEQINQGELSIGDLLEIMRVAVADGEGNLAICLAMASNAASTLHMERGGK